MKRILIAVVAILVIPVVGMAQTGSLTVLTSPPGANIKLEGEARLSGVSPITFSYRLVGKYRLEVTKDGYESYSTTLMIDPATPQQLEVRLSKKTAGKAALRSFLFPGWGQKYSGQKTKSILFGTLFVGTAVALYKTHNTYIDRRDEWSQLDAEYGVAVVQGGSIADLSRLYVSLDEARQRAYDAESDRRLATGVTIGLWGISLLDALLFTPTERATFSIKGLTINPSASPERTGVTFSMAF